MYTYIHTYTRMFTGINIQNRSVMFTGSNYCKDIRYTYLARSGAGKQLRTTGDPREGNRINTVRFLSVRHSQGNYTTIYWLLDHNFLLHTDIF